MLAHVLAELTRELEKAGIAPALIGGLAASARGGPDSLAMARVQWFPSRMCVSLARQHTAQRT